MGHFLHDQLLREYAFASHVKHGDECILRERASTGCGEAVAFLLREEVWRVVGGYDVDESRANGCTKRLTISEGLDSGIPLDAVA